MSEPSTILFAGGGTGGHLYPGISVAQVLHQRMPEAKPLFLCTNRPIDKVILDPTGFEYIPQPVVPVVRTVAGLLKFWRGWRETHNLVRRVLHERKPVAVLGLGGYAAGVAVKVAGRRGIPAGILNPDVIPGKANRYLMNYVREVYCQFEQSREHVRPDDQGKLRVTGCPIRSDMIPLPARDAAIARLELDRKLSTLVITGASLGAQTVNDAMVEVLSGMTLSGWQILHLAGRDHADKVRAGYREKNVKAHVIDFTPAMAEVWAVADLCVSRAGASSCAELTACGVPSILLPYPYHKDMHQRANAKVLADAGAAVLIDDEKDAKKNAAKLKPVLESLLSDANQRKSMADAARKLGRPDAATAVAEAMMQMIASGR